MFLHRLINGDYPIIHTLSIANEKSLHNEACNVLDGLLKKKKKKHYSGKYQKYTSYLWILGKKARLIQMKFV